MKLPLALVLTLLLPALTPAQSVTAETPLFALPYSPSLDLTSMDRSVDPCVDFYRYTCGGWIKANPIPADQSRWNVYAKLTNDNQRFLWGILQQAADNSKSRSALETEVGDYFQACMDQATQQKIGSVPLMAELKEIDALRSLRDLAVFLARVHLTSNGGAEGTGVLFGFGSGQDFADSSRVIAFASAGGLGLPDRDYYIKTDAKSQETRQKYLEHVRDLLQLAGETPAQAAHDAQVVMEIETELAKASLTKVDQRDPHKLFHPLRMQQLQSLTPAFPWKQYLEELTTARDRVVSAEPVAVVESVGKSKAPSYGIINVTEPAFFKEVQVLLREKSLDDWKAYLRWHVAHERAPFLSAPFVEANFNFYRKYLRGIETMPARWKICVRRVDMDLGEALGQIFVQKTFDADTKARTLKMTQEIEAQMQKEIEQLPWMGSATKKRALEKLHHVANKIGYPERWRDYSSIRISREDYLGNVERAAAFETRRDLNKIGKPLDRGEWGMTPPTVNAYFNSQMNDINFPAGVLQPPLYDPKMDDAPNYGNTGATIGHELTHGFDDEGRQFDSNGNLKDWWKMLDAEEFSKRAKCVSDEYSQFTVVDQIKINSALTLGEDVADLGGTYLAYLAWKDATKNQNLQPVDGLTPGQRFFVGMAQWACGDTRPETKRMEAITNPHSPDEFRINGVVSNLPEFGKAFACRAGQPMVRATACKIW